MRFLSRSFVITLLTVVPIFISSVAYPQSEVGGSDNARIWNFWANSEGRETAAKYEWYIERFQHEGEDHLYCIIHRRINPSLHTSEIKVMGLNEGSYNPILQGKEADQFAELIISKFGRWVEEIETSRGINPRILNEITAKTGSITANQADIIFVSKGRDVLNFQAGFSVWRDGILPVERHLEITLPRAEARLTYIFPPYRRILKHQGDPLYPLWVRIKGAVELKSFVKDRSAADFVPFIYDIAVTSGITDIAPDGESHVAEYYSEVVSPAMKVIDEGLGLSHVYSQADPNAKGGFIHVMHATRDQFNEYMAGVMLKSKGFTVIRNSQSVSGRSGISNDPNCINLLDELSTSPL
jgi:hypothetical protein